MLLREKKTSFLPYNFYALYILRHFGRKKSNNEECFFSKSVYSKVFLFHFSAIHPFTINFFNPLTTTRYKNAGQLWEFLTTLFLYGLHCKFYTGEPCLSAVYSKKQNQFIIYRTHFRSVYVPKSRFFGKNAVHCSGALLKKRKRFFLYFLNGYRYHKNFNRFEFQALKAIFSTIFKKFWWKISPHC